MAKDTIVIAGALAQKHGVGGHAWVLLQYLLGFRSLGWKVLLLDCIDPAQCRDRSGRFCPVRESIQWAFAQDTLRPFDLDRQYCAVTRGQRVALGLSYRELCRRVASCRALFNINGFLTDLELLEAAPCRVFLDIDPGFNQFWHELGLAPIPAHHDRYITVAANLGREDCPIPTCGLDWIPIAPPVYLDCWAPAWESTRPFTSICSWRGAFAPVQYQGRTLGLRVHEFRRFVSLPRETGEAFELALRIDPGEIRDMDSLKESGWRLIPPDSVSSTASRYHEFIQSSRAEFGVAKNLYVATGSGWFSDRTACYLASAKPALVQDTGLADHYPVGEGLLLFSSLKGAVEGVRRIQRDYPRHARRARAFAEGYLASDRVLGEMLKKLSLS